MAVEEDFSGLRGTEEDCTGRSGISDLSEDVEAYLQDVYGAERLQKISQALRKTPNHSCLRVNTSKTTTEDVKEVLSAHITSGIIKRLECIPDAILIPHSTIASEYPNTTGKRIVVSQKAAESALRGAAIFVPGVLGISQGVEIGDIVDVYAAFTKACGSSVYKRGTILKAGCESKLQAKYVGQAKMYLSRKAIFRRQEGIAAKLTCDLVPIIPEELKDRVFLQNLPSIITAHVLGPNPDSVVLDMCAAPGGKSTHLAQLMGNKGVIYALDNRSKRVDQIKKLALSLGTSSVQPILYDATKCLSKGNTMFTLEQFDYILLDPPCSALGLRPKLQQMISLHQLQACASYQRLLLKEAILLLKPGGFLVYSTCTINPGENEENVRFVLDNFSCMRLVRQNPNLGSSGMQHPFRDSSKIYLSAEESSLVQRFDPDDDLDTIGFFIAKLQKKG